MISTVTPNPVAGENVSYGEIAAIERVLKSSIAQPQGTTMPAMDTSQYLDLSAEIDELDYSATPCYDQDHHVSLIDVTGPSAAAIVEFTDCSGASFSDLYVLQKSNDQWVISGKVWDSHAHS